MFASGRHRRGRTPTTLSCAFNGVATPRLHASSTHDLNNKLLSNSAGGQDEAGGGAACGIDCLGIVREQVSQLATVAVVSLHVPVCLLQLASSASTTASCIVVGTILFSVAKASNGPTPARSTDLSHDDRCFVRSFYNNVKVLRYELNTKVLCLLERAKVFAVLHCGYRPYPSG